MRYLWIVLLFAIIFIIATLSNTNTVILDGRHNKASIQRIISLSPNITETLFSLGLGDKVVGVSHYCDYPEQALALPKAGDLINPNLEAIVKLAPDLVILSAKQTRTIAQLQQLNIATLGVESSRFTDVLDTIKIIGDMTQHQAQAAQLLASMNAKISLIKQKVAHRPRPTVMLTLGHSTNSAQINTLYIAGQQDFYNDLIQLAGGENSYTNSQISVPTLSIEGIIQLNPQIIIDVFPEADDHSSDLKHVMKQWKNLHYLDAIKTNRVHIIEQNYATIPGPRLIQLLDDLARLIHPEINWDLH